MSRLFGETLRTTPAEADSPGHGLLLRAAYIRSVAPGIFSYLPLGLRTGAKIEAIVRQELDSIGAQEVAMPLVQPVRLRRAAGRTQSGEEEVRFGDRAGRDLLLGTSHEEVAAELARSDITSYRQLPATLYQIRPTFRDELRPLAGPLRAREFDLMDCYSFDRDRAGLDERCAAVRRAFERIFRRVGLAELSVASSVREEEIEDEFYLLSDVGDERLAVCDGCSYVANLRAARFAKPEPTAEAAEPLEKVATPGTDTIAALAEYLDVPTARTAKVVLLSANMPGEAEGEREVVVMALVRGDMEVSESKVAAAIGARRLWSADARAIRAVGAVPGFASPIGLESDDLIVAVDELVAGSTNLVSGANEEGYHLRNVNFQRDYVADVVTDIAAAFPGAPCPECGAPLRLAACLEIGSLHRFAQAYGESLGVSFQDQDGTQRTLAIGSYGIGIGRLLACVAETHHDEHGLRWPVEVAPYQVQLVVLSGGDTEIARQGEDLYSSLCQARVEVLYDDREVSGGVKFNDADLIGLPLRLTLGRRSLQEGGVELKRRDREERQIVGIAGALDSVTSVIPA
ncbi:MAG: proline--tRNA ligase [Gemmatimonadales bacterium]